MGPHVAVERVEGDATDGSGFFARDEVQVLDQEANSSTVMTPPVAAEMRTAVASMIPALTPASTARQVGWLTPASLAAALSERPCFTRHRRTFFPTLIR
jgi:hypothetical protein